MQNRNNVKATYFLDFQRLLRHFPADFRTFARFGDVRDVSLSPSFVKTRPVEGANENSILLRLNSIRHLRPITGSLSYREKKGTLVWRGKVKSDNKGSTCDTWRQRSKAAVQRPLLANDSGCCLRRTWRMIAVNTNLLVARIAPNWPENGVQEFCTPDRNFSYFGLLKTHNPLV